MAEESQKVNQAFGGIVTLLHYHKWNLNAEEKTTSQVSSKKQEGLGRI
jgi:hypothetical protein